MKHKEILELIEDDWNSDRDNRDAGIDDLRYLSGEGQWTDAEKAEREAKGLVTITVNLLQPFIRQVSNDIKQLQPSVKTVPVDDKSDPVISEIFDGLIRQIEIQSNAAAAYGHGGAMAVACGTGHWRIDTEMVRDAVYEQEIKIKRVKDPFSVVWDGGSIEHDRSDARHCNVTSYINKRDFKRKYPNAKREAQDIDITTGYGTYNDLSWDNDDKSRISEHWFVKDVKRKLVMIDTGQTYDITDWSHNDIVSLSMQHEIVGERLADSFTVHRQMLDGVDFLSDVEDWAGMHIPIIPCFGDEISFNNTDIRSGMVRGAKDPQKAYNYWRSSAIEHIAKAPKSKYIVTADQIAGHEKAWATMNTSNTPFLPYNFDPDNPSPPPQRDNPPTPPSAMWQESQFAHDEIKSTTGIFDASLGSRGNEISGVAIQARAQQGDSANFQYIDNFNHAIKRTGEILVDLIPRVYDTDRIVRVIGKDDESKFVPINRTVMSNDGQPIIINDISQARFDVKIKTGPSHATQRIEAREQIGNAMQGNPELWGVIGDLYFKNSDFPGADDIAKRLAKTLPPELQDDDKQQQQPQPDPMAEAMQRLEIETKQADLAEKKAKTDKAEAETVKIQIEAQSAAFDLGVQNTQ